MRKLALSLALVILLVLAPAAAAQAQVMLGDQGVASYGDSNAAGVAQAFEYTATASGTASDIEMYVNSGTTATSVTVGLYSNASGKPGSLMASGSLTSPVAGQWDDVKLSVAPSVTQGTVYWVALLGTGGQVNYPDTPGGSGESYVNANSGLSALPATYSPGTEYQVSPASMYVQATQTAPIMLVGDQSVASMKDNNSAGVAQAFEYTAEASGTTSSVQAYVDNGSTASSVEVGLYANSGGKPGQLLSSGSMASPTAGAWNSVKIGAASVTSGTTYWIALLGTGGHVDYRDTAGGSAASYVDSASGLSSLPSTYSAGNEYNVSPASAYVMGTGSSGGGSAPSNTAAPSVSGTAQQGDTLSASTGSWSGSPTGYGYQWRDCNSSGGSCANVSGATGSSYVLGSGDVGHTMDVVVTASNSGGSGSASSAATGVVAASSGGSGPTVNYFVAQTAAGSGNGSSCANAEAVSTLGGASEWTPGNVIGLCGTITSPITAQGSGTSGAPITVYWEPGASMSLSAASCMSGCVNLNNRSYITLDGGTNGVIQATNNGDGRSLTDAADGVQVNSTNNVTIEYLTIQDMFVKNQGTSTGTPSDQAGIWDAGSTNLVIDHDTLVQDGAIGIAIDPAAGPTTISNDDLSEENWTIAVMAATDNTLGPLYIDGNHIHDMANWDDPSDNNHHNGIFCFTAGDTTYDPHYNGFYLYNNLFNGDPGADATSWDTIQSCSDDATHYYVFNNIFAGSTHDPGNGDLNSDKGIDPDYNNTLVGATSNSFLVWMAYSGVHDLRNNIVYNGAIGEPTRSGCGGSAPSGYPCPTYNPAPSHNLYANSLGGNGLAFDCPPSNGEYNWSTGWSHWVSCVGEQSTSFGPPGSSQTVTNPNLDSNYDPTSGSAALGAGENLYSLCNGQPNPGLGALCYTYAGPTPSGPGAGPNGQWATPTARPTTAAWNIGAY